MGFFFRTKAKGEESPDVGRSSKSPLVPPPISPDVSRIVISKSSPREGRNVIQLEDSPSQWNTVLAPRSPSMLYSSSSPGCSSPLEPKKKKKEKNLRNFNYFDTSPTATPAGQASPNLSRRGGKEPVGSSSPLMPRRMVTSPVLSPTNRREDNGETEKKSSPIVQIDVRSVEMAHNGVTCTSFEHGGRMLVHPAQSFKISSPLEGEGNRYTVSVTRSENAMERNENEDVVEALHPKKLVLCFKPMSYTLVEDDTFITIHLDKKTGEEKVKTFEEILSSCCHFEKTRWQREIRNKESVAVEAYEAGDLRFEVGDKVNIIRDDGIGYLFGEVGGNKGRFPAFYVKLEEDESELPFKGEYKLYRMLPGQNEYEIHPNYTEFTKNGSWMQGWIQMKNHSTGQWTDCYLQAKTCGLLWYQGSKDAPDGFVTYPNIWTVTYPLKENEEENPFAFSLVCKNQRLIISTDDESKTSRWIHALEHLRKFLNQN